MTSLKTPKYTYYDLCSEILNHGIYSNTTKMLKNVCISFDMSELDTSEVALMQYRLSNKLSSVKYAIAEFLWYASKRRSIELIEPFGKIWRSMTDDDGLVNSNYGYQIFNNQNVEYKIEDLVSNGSAKFYIISKENIESKTDATCNNIVKVELDSSGELSCRVYARSIDMLFGYPYDILSAQIFLRYIQRKLESVYHLKTTISSIDMIIHNAHIYLSHLVSLTDYDASRFDSSKHYILNVDTLFDSARSIDFDATDALDKIIKLRNELSEDRNFVSVRNLMQYSTLIKREFEEIQIKRMRFSELIDMIDIKSLGRLYRVVDSLRADQFDRKNAVLNLDQLMYLDYIDNDNLEVTFID